MDLPVEYTVMRDDTRMTRDGAIARERVVMFYLGKFGPFTERFAAEDFSDTALQTRVDTLRRQLETLHRG